MPKPAEPSPSPSEAVAEPLAPSPSASSSSSSPSASSAAVWPWRARPLPLSRSAGAGSRPIRGTFGTMGRRDATTTLPSLPPLPERTTSKLRPPDEVDDRGGGDRPLSTYRGLVEVEGEAEAERLPDADVPMTETRERASPTGEDGESMAAGGALDLGGDEDGGGGGGGGRAGDDGCADPASAPAGVRDEAMTLTRPSQTLR